MVRLSTVAMAAGFALGCQPVSSQDFNYVPGWANTTNHRFQGGSGGEWEAKSELFSVLGSLDPDIDCTLKNLNDQDGNVIVNRYRREHRRNGEQAALRDALQQVGTHFRDLRAKDRC